MMTFHDFLVNGVAVEVSEFNTPFTVKKSGKTSLPTPATVFLPTTNILNAAWKAITNSKVNWNVTGRAWSSVNSKNSASPLNASSRLTLTFR